MPSELGRQGSNESTFRHHQDNVALVDDVAGGHERMLHVLDYPVFDVHWSPLFQYRFHCVMGLPLVYRVLFGVSLCSLLSN